MNKRILVVDDNRSVLETLEAILKYAGYIVSTAEDGMAAVEIAWREKPDLVLTDGLLPKLHGFLVCKTIKEWDSPPKVILFTGVYTKPSYSWEIKQKYGADDVLIKPASPELLLACIEKHLRISPSAKFTSSEMEHRAEYW